jgi:hypothetical protein
MSKQELVAPPAALASGAHISGMAAYRALVHEAQADPAAIRFGDNLPNKSSGKIMHRLLRSLAKGETITQDTSTLENLTILEQLDPCPLTRSPR